MRPTIDRGPGQLTINKFRKHLYVYSRTTSQSIGQPVHDSKLSFRITSKTSCSYLNALIK